MLNGDVPLVEAELVTGRPGARAGEAGAALALVSFETWEPGRLGRVIRTADGERVTRIVEAKDATPDELGVGEVNAGLYAFDAAWLRGAIGRLTPSPATGELYLTQLVDLANADGRPVVAFEAADDGTLDGINDRVQLAEATAMLRERINVAWMRAGVTMLDPATAFVDAGRGAGPRRHAGAERDPARPDPGGGGDRHRRRQPADRQRSSGRAAASGPASWSAPRWRRGPRSGRSATCARAARSGPASSSATSPR